MNPSHPNFLFNLAGGGIIVFVVGYMLTSFFTTPDVELCSRRFPAGMQLSYADADGKLLSPVSLQARSYGRKWGFRSNIESVPVENEQFTNAMQVTMAPAESGDDDRQRSGIGFVWQPRDLAKAHAACLSYSVFIPSNFTFPEVGYLPGLFGSKSLEDIDEIRPADSFATRVVWQPSGDVGVELRDPQSGASIQGANRKTVWPTGRWVPVEQEIRLNTEGESNGIVRTWIDGQLVADRDAMTLRKHPAGGLSGVVADIGYASMQGPVTALRISPFVVRWQ